jgi:hypothetical protein
MAILAALRDCLRTRAALQMEVLALRHQLNVFAALGEASEADRRGSISLGPFVAVLDRLAVCPAHRETGDGDYVALQRVSGVLDLEGAPRQPGRRRAVPFRLTHG